MSVRVSWWLLRRIARYPRADAVLFTECPVVAGGTSYGVVVSRCARFASAARAA